MSSGRIPSVEGGIQPTIVDAKGDLIVATAADTVSRLAVGSNGETLVADSSATTGLRWQVPVNVNPVLNSAFQIWQRGTSVATSTTSVKNYTADQWNLFRGALASGATISRQLTNDTTNLPFIQYCARVQRDSGNTNTGIINLYQSLETLNSVQFAGRTVTMSFYARAGANYSATSNALAYSLNTGTGTDQNGANSGFTGLATPINQTATLTTTWQRFSASGTLATNLTQVGFNFTFSPTGTAGAADFFEITGVQLEIGSVATPFKTNGGTLAGELAACQRYYARNETTAGFTALSGWGMATTTTTVGVNWELSVPMRIAPVVLEYGNLRATDTVGVASNISTLVLDGTTPTTINLSASGLSGFTQYRPAIIQNRISGTGYIAVSAEL